MTQRYINKRDAILHAAAQLFNQHGIKGTMLSDVANRVGLSTNSITYYYKKKEDLVVACLLSSIEAINNTIAIAVKLPAVEERVRGFIKLFINRLASIQANQCPEMMSFRDVQILVSPHAEIIFAAYTDMFRRVRRLLSTDVVSVDNRISLNARTHLLLSLTTWAMTWITRYDPEDYDQVAKHMGDILIGGIASSSSHWGTSILDNNLTFAPSGADATRDGFLRAATALINELGYRGASVDRISARLNVTKGSFYHHNPSKEDLIAECLDRTFSVIRRMQMIVATGTGSGWDKLCAVSRALVRYQFSGDGPLLRISAWSELPDDLYHEKLKTLKQLTERFVSFMVDGMKDGSICPLHQSIAALQVTGMINASTSLDRWVPDVNENNAIDLFTRPLFMGILSI